MSIINIDIENKIYNSTNYDKYFLFKFWNEFYIKSFYLLNVLGLVIRILW